MECKDIIMSFTVPPGLDDLQTIAESILDSFPEELIEFCDNLVFRVEELADEALEQELELDDPFDLVALFRSGKQISPGIESKTANDDDVLILFRRPLLDMWCETCEDLNILTRQVMIEELGQHFDFSDEEIDEMTSRHYQGMF